MTDHLPRLIITMEQYLRGEVTGQRIVSAVDEFVSSDKVYDLPDALSSKILDLQNRSAMYVADPAKRAEYSGYMDDEELKKVLISFLDRIKN